MRIFVTILGIVVVLGALVSLKYAQIASLIGAAAAMETAGPPPEAVATARAAAQEWEATISATGTVASSKGVVVSNEVAGVVSSIAFESGAVVERGAVLVQLDARVEKAQLAQAQVRRNLARTTAERARKLASSGAESQAQIDADENALAAANAEIDVLRAQIARKTIRAPFSGKLGIREINLGQYLNPGTTVTTLEAVEGVYVDFDVPQQQDITVGMKVRVTLEGVPGFVGKGEVFAIEPRVNASTRTKSVRAAITEGSDALRPGMFAQVEVIRPETLDVVAIPATAVLHATYGDSVFIVEPPPPERADRTGPGGEPVFAVRQQFVRLGVRRGDFVAVLAGIEPGQEVVTEGAFKLRNGAPIYVDNTRALEPSLAPVPANR
ncbi:MAG TPA: efflux RND transporter periplasmic adaptor subunit [Nannocystaceae bacterium]|nr:efflux RND transporter periplasmic adaptor subunit [Nannocystaceae bacterium]